MTIILLSTFTSAFGQSVRIDRWQLIAKRVKSITVTDNFQWRNGTEVKKESNILDISYYDTTGSIIKLIEYGSNSETQTDFIYNQYNQLTDTKRSYKSTGVTWDCFIGLRPIIKSVTKYDKKYGRVKSEATVYRHHNSPRSMVKLNYLYNDKGLLDKKIYAYDKNNHYIQIKYEYYE